MASAQPLHLGLTPWRLSARLDAQELGRQGALAEQWGYQSFWLPESHFAGAGAVPDPLMLLAAVAAHTRSIQLATTSYLLPLRHPMQAAEQVAVLDQLSGGRVILGVGRGYQPRMFDAFGVSRKDKRRLFAWCLEQMQAAWRGEPIGGAAQTGSSAEEDTAVTLSPLPVQQPHPPIWVAAFGPKALAQAGRLGLPYLASPMEPIARLHENYQRHAAASRDAGVPRPPEVPIMRTVFVSEERALLAQVREQLAASARQLATSGARQGIVATPEDWAIVGEPAEVRDAVAHYVETLGMTHLIVTRLRIGQVEAATLERSVRLAAEALGG